jgi:hypothetical protein
MRTLVAILVAASVWAARAGADTTVISDGIVQFPTPVPFCTGDCDGNRRVSVSEVQRGVKGAVGPGAVTGRACSGYAEPLRVDQVIEAVSNALSGCP